MSKNLRESDWKGEGEVAELKEGTLQSIFLPPPLVSPLFLKRMMQWYMFCFIVALNFHACISHCVSVLSFDVRPIVELLSLITYLPSFTLFAGFLLNKELNTNCFFLPLNLQTTMVYHFCLTSSSSTFSSRWLRSSSDTRLLRIPSFRLKSFGQRKFSYQASVLWNSLPISFCHYNSTLAFKSALKTHLFPSQ